MPAEAVPPHGRSYPAEPISKTRVFARSTAVTLATIGFIVMVVALASDRWGWLQINVPNRDDIYVTRGLFGVSIGSHDGSDVYTHYFQDDAFGFDLDPYCGSSSRPSVFALFLPVLVQQLNTTLPDNVCCGGGDDFIFSANRDDSSNDWCDQRDAIIGTAITSVVLAGLAVLATSIFCCVQTTNGRLIPFLVFAFLSAALGLAASIIWGVWLEKEDDDRDDRGIPAEGDLRSGFGMVGFTIGWLLVAIGALFELLACCRSKKEHPPPMHRLPGMMGVYGAPAYPPPQELPNQTHPPEQLGTYGAPTSPPPQELANQNHPPGQAPYELPYPIGPGGPQASQGQAASNGAPPQHTTTAMAV